MVGISGGCKRKDRRAGPGGLAGRGARGWAAGAGPRELGRGSWAGRCRRCWPRAYGRAVTRLAVPARSWRAGSGSQPRVVAQPGSPLRANFVPVPRGGGLKRLGFSGCVCVCEMSLVGHGASRRAPMLGE